MPAFMTLLRCFQNAALLYGPYLPPGKLIRRPGVRGRRLARRRQPGSDFGIIADRAQRPADSAYDFYETQSQLFAIG
jgi:hypothetical protein